MKLVIVYSPVYEYALGNPKRIGGAERQQWLLARTLAKAGWVVTVGVREGLKLKERVVIDGVNFVGIGQGQYLLSYYRFLVSEQPDWCYWRAAEHWLGLVVQVAKFVGVRTIFAAAFDTDIEPRHALTHHPQLWPESEPVTTADVPLHRFSWDSLMRTRRQGYRQSPIS